LRRGIGGHPGHTRFALFALAVKLVQTFTKKSASVSHQAHHLRRIDASDGCAGGHRLWFLPRVDVPDCSRGCADCGTVDDELSHVVTTTVVSVSPSPDTTTEQAQASRGTSLLGKTTVDIGMWFTSMVAQSCLFKTVLAR